MAKITTPAMERLDKKRNSKRRNKPSTPGREAWLRFKRNKTALVGLVVVILLILIAIFADFIAPFDYREQDYMAMSQPPSAEHIFGTDSYGRDLFSRCIYGARYSLGIGLLCVIASFALGGTLGIIAGYFGGRVDTIIMRFMDVFQAIPQVLLAICIVAVLGNGIPQLVVAIMISTMPVMAKNNRAAILQVKSNDYVEACRAIGVGKFRMIIKHMIPNALGVMIIFIVGLIGASIMIMSGLSYIGVGLAAPTPEWGLILNEGKAFLRSAPYMVLFPAMMIMITCFSFNLLGDGLRDAFDPKLK